MEYFINKRIHFDSDNGLLMLTGNEQSAIQLSRQGCRLLSELITHCGNTVSRENLLQRVWEEQALTPSDGNLSNHISLLRKHFFQLGIKKNIIITVPKTGFRLEADISLRAFSKEKFFSLKKRKDISLNITDNKENKDQKWIQKKGHVYPLIATIVTLSVLLPLSLYKVNRTASNLDRCKIIDLAGNRGLYLAEELKALTTFIKKNNIDCKKDNSIIYFKFTNALPRQNNGDMRVIFLAQCRRRNDNRITHCANYWSATLKR